MDINDYNTRLNQARNRYNESAQELKDNYARREEDLQALHKSRESNQRRNYENQKLDREAESEVRLRRYDKNLKEALDERTTRYMNEMGEARESFEKDRRMQMDDYNQKLSKISQSFDTASKEKDKLHALYKNNIDERYDEGLDAREKHFNKSLATMQKTMEEDVNEFRDQQTLERRKLITDFDNEKKELVQEASIARNKANNAHQLEMERLRDNARQKEDTLRNNFESANVNLRKNKDRENEQQRDTFEKLTADIQERNVAALKKLNRQNKAEKRDLEKSFSEDRIELERRTNKLINEGSANRVSKTKDDVEKKYKERIVRLNEQMEENNYHNIELNRRIAQEQADEIDKIEIKHAQSIDDKNNEIRELKEQELAQLKDKVEKYQETMNKRQKTLEIEKEKNAVESRQKLVNSLDRQRTEYGRTINQINSANRLAVSDLRNEMTKEQSKFIEKTKEDVHEELVEMKDSYDDKVKKTEASLGQKLTIKGTLSTCTF